MITKELKGGRIRAVRIEMDYRHKNGTLTSDYPLEGLLDFQKVMCAITESKLLRPTTAQTFSLVDFALRNGGDEQCRGIVCMVRQNRLWTATENLYGEDNVILYDNIDGKMPSDRESLLKRFKDGDEAVRVVPYEFKRGVQSISDLVKNPYIIGQVRNKDFAEDVVARVAKKISKLKLPPCVYVLGGQNTDTHKYTSVSSDWGGGGLVVGGNNRDVDEIGCASGVHPAKQKLLLINIPLY